MTTYRYETHLHTKEASLCALSTAQDIVKAYKEAGYDGIIITDHFFNGNTSIPPYFPWKDRIELFCKGYENALWAGKQVGLKVFFGLETGFCGTEFLLYGVNKEWLKEQSDMLSWSVEEQYKNVHNAGGMVIHAHPFREASYISEIRLYPKCVDGVEVVNTSNQNLWNKSAFDYARKHKLPMTGGSDQHSTKMLNGGINSEIELNSIEDYIELILSKKNYKPIPKEGQDFLL